MGALAKRIAGAVLLGALSAHAQTPSPLGVTLRFRPESLVVLRGGSGAAALSNLAQPLTLVEYSTSGEVLGTVPVPQATSGRNNRCLGTWYSGLQTELFIQRSFDGASAMAVSRRPPFPELMREVSLGR